MHDSFLDDLCCKIDSSIPTLLAGDFNTVFDRPDDRVGSSPEDTSRESSVALRRFYLISVVLRTFGAVSFPLSLVLPGPDGIIRVPPASTFLGFPTLGSLMWSHWTFWRVFFLITVVCFCLCLSQTPFPQVLVS